MPNQGDEVMMRTFMSLFGPSIRPLKWASVTKQKLWSLKLASPETIDVGIIHKPFIDISLKKVCSKTHDWVLGVETSKK